MVSSANFTMKLLSDVTKHFDVKGEYNCGLNVSNITCVAAANGWNFYFREPAATKVD